jgi:hypothetical protein
MPVTVDSGLQATDDPLSNDLAVSMENAVANADKDTSQFSTMLMKLSPQTAKSFKEEWLEDQFLPTNTALSVSAASADTTFAITTNEGSYARANSIALVVQTGEHVRITGVSASAWTVVRAVGSVSAATAASGTSLGGLMIVAGAAEEGSTLPTALVTEKTTSFNYVQRVRNSFRFTNTARWVNWYSGEPIKYQRKKIAIEHKRELEQIGFFGGRSYTASGGNGYPLTSSGGLDHFISTNVTDAGGTLDKAEFADFLRSGMEYGDRSRKVLFAAPIVTQVLSEFLQDNWVRARPEDSVWGVKVDAVIEPSYIGARIPVFVKPDWKRFGEGTGKHIGSRAYLVDMSAVEMFKAPPVGGVSRYATLLQNRQANDADETAEEFLSEIGFKVKLEKAHAKLTGVTG